MNQWDTIMTLIWIFHIGHVKMHSFLLSGWAWQVTRFAAKILKWKGLANVATSMIQGSGSKMMCVVPISLQAKVS
jgi:hypothetical protein